MVSAPFRPAVRYHGGKWLLAPWIISHFPQHKTYDESYGGGASVLLRKKRAHSEIYNDLDSEIVGFFRVLQNPQQAAALKRAIEVTPFAREEFEIAYEPTDDPVERARRLVIRSYMGFSSASVLPQHRTGFRATSKRSGSSPAWDWRNYPESIEALVDRLRGVVIENRRAIDLIKYHDAPDTLHYVDPPYVQSTRAFKSRESSQVYPFEMSNEDHEELAEVLHGSKGMVVLSGYESDLYSRLYCDWETRTKTTFTTRQQPRQEVLWLNPAVVEALQREGRSINAQYNLGLI